MRTFAAMIARIGSDVDHAAALLRAGEAVAIPTETVYGLAANTFDEGAVIKIFSIKERPSFDPLIVHIAEQDHIRRVAKELPAGAEALMDAFWPGPITLVVPKRPEVPDLVTSGLDSVAVRMPSHPMTLALLREVGVPLAAPSANPFGYISPTTAQHVADQLGAKVPYILDGGPCAVGVESTIVGWDRQQRKWMLYRPGGIPLERIAALIGPIAAADMTKSPVAPGMIESHYAPRKPIHVGDVDALMKRYSGRSVGVISFSNEYQAHRCEMLSETRDLEEAARNLFAVLRELDASDCTMIIAERFPEEGLGRAINDRLRRAAAK